MLIFYLHSVKWHEVGRKLNQIRTYYIMFNLLAWNSVFSEERIAVQGLYPYIDNSQCKFICHLQGNTNVLLGSVALFARPLALLMENFAYICILINVFNKPHFAESG